MFSAPSIAVWRVRGFAESAVAIYRPRPAVPTELCRSRVASSVGLSDFSEFYRIVHPIGDVRQDGRGKTPADRGVLHGRRSCLAPTETRRISDCVIGAVVIALRQCGTSTWYKMRLGMDRSSRPQRSSVRLLLQRVA